MAPIPQAIIPKIVVISGVRRRLRDRRLVLQSRTKYALLLVSAVVISFSLIGGIQGGARAQDSAIPYLSTLTEIIERIRSDYVDDPSIAEAMEGAIRGMVERVDPHGGYLSAETAAFYESFDPLVAPGIGVVLSKKFDYPIIVAATPGGPAAEAGLGTGDTIEGIDGETLREHNLVEVYQLLSGVAGSTVELNVIRRRAAAAESITLTRAGVAVPPVEARMLEGSIGYVKVSLLGPGTAAEASARIQELASQGARGLVLDLRNSAGGIRKEGFDLADLFLQSGELGYLEGQTVERETFAASPENAAGSIPLTILINEGTADAAELAAAAIRDNERGELVGVRTFGFAAEQQLLPLGDGTALLLSLANYYTPAGDEIQTQGVTPTVEVAATEAEDPLALPGSEPEDRDRQLDRALEILSNQTAGQTAA
jgi:carboxyl-terminal processing protease